MSIELNGTTGIDFNDGSNQSTAATPYGRKNLIINGDMRIAQRGTSETGITTSGYYTVDRWYPEITTAGTWTMTQDTDVPSGQGFSSSLKMACTTADASLAASDLVNVTQRFEGQMLQHLKKGTSNAESLTLSFWVKSNKTGTYIIELDDNDNARNINQSYTINAADTWEKKTLTFAGDTAGALDNDNNHSFRMYFWLAAGSNFTSGTLQTSWGSTVNANRVVGQVNLADSTANYINITGCQLEIGDAASDFEFMPYDMELQRCQRYYQTYTTSRVNTPLIGFATSGSQVVINITMPQYPRVLGWEAGDGTFTKLDDINVNGYPSTSDNISSIDYWRCIGQSISVGMTTTGTITSGDAELVRVGTGVYDIFSLDTEL